MVKLAGGDKPVVVAGGGFEMTKAARVCVQCELRQSWAPHLSDAETGRCGPQLAILVAARDGEALADE